MDINTSITWPNAQFYDFYFSNKNAQMIDIFDESAVEKRKQAQFDQMMHDAHIY